MVLGILISKGDWTMNIMEERIPTAETKLAFAGNFNQKRKTQENWKFPFISQWFYEAAASYTLQALKAKVPGNVITNSS